MEVYMQSEDAFIVVLVIVSVLVLGGVLGHAAYGSIVFNRASPEEQRLILEKDASEDLITITLEGHDYFRCPTTHGRYVLTHKGNCRGCGTISAEVR